MEIACSMSRVNRPKYLELREKAGFRTDSQVAAEIDISRQRLSQILNDDDISGASFGVIDRLAWALRCSIDDLINRTPSDEEQD